MESVRKWTEEIGKREATAGVEVVRQLDDEVEVPPRLIITYVGGQQVIEQNKLRLCSVWKGRPKGDARVDMVALIGDNPTGLPHKKDADGLS